MGQGLWRGVEMGEQEGGSRQTWGGEGKWWGECPPQPGQSTPTHASASAGASWSQEPSGSPLPPLPRGLPAHLNTCGDSRQSIPGGMAACWAPSSLGAPVRSHTCHTALITSQHPPGPPHPPETPPPLLTCAALLRGPFPPWLGSPLGRLHLQPGAFLQLRSGDEGRKGNPI